MATMATGGHDIQASSQCAETSESSSGRTIVANFKQIAAKVGGFPGKAFRLRIMVTGETGVGKSTILNALVGTKVLEVGRKSKQRVTTDVTEKVCVRDNIEIVVIYCPGLHDGTDNEAEYIQEMKDVIDRHGGIDLLLYCKRMNVLRADVATDVDIIRKLTEGLGAKIWRHALFVLTFANTYERVLQTTRKMSQDKIRAEFKARQKEWKRVIEDGLKMCRVKCRVEVCLAGHKKPQLCGRPYWLSDFWASAYKVLKKNGEAAAALVRLNQSRLVQEEALEEYFNRDLEDQHATHPQTQSAQLNTPSPEIHSWCTIM